MVVVYLELLMGALACVAMSGADWTTIHRLAEQVFQRGVISPLDAKSVSTRTPSGFIAGLGQLVNKNENPIDRIRNLGRLGRHAHITFLYSGDAANMLAVKLYSDLEVSETEDATIFIVSGTLDLWQTAVIDFAKQGSEPALTAFAFLAVQQFDGLGMGHMFDDYSRKIGHHGLTLSKK